MVLVWEGILFLGEEDIKNWCFYILVLFGVLKKCWLLIWFVDYLIYN